MNPTSTIPTIELDRPGPWLVDGGGGVLIEVPVLAAWRAWVPRDGDDEAGGLLAGAASPIGGVCVTLATTPLPGDERGPSRYRRADPGHLDPLRVPRGPAWLGEWHTHPAEDHPIPSALDVREWARLVGGARELGLTHPGVFVILARQGIGVWVWR